MMRPSVVMSPTTAVHPDGSFKNEGSARRSSSVLMKAWVRAVV